MKDIKFRYVLAKDENVFSLIFTLKEIEENGLDYVYEKFEKTFSGRCNCLNESCNHCECGTIFDDYEIISRDLCIEQEDIKGQEIYVKDIITDLCEKGSLYQVFYDRVECAFMLHDFNNNSDLMWCDIEEPFRKGNIHEHIVLTGVRE